MFDILPEVSWKTQGQLPTVVTGSRSCLFCFILLFSPLINRSSLGSPPALTFLTQGPFLGYPIQDIPLGPPTLCQTLCQVTNSTKEWAYKAQHGLAPAHLYCLTFNHSHTHFSSATWAPLKFLQHAKSFLATLQMLSSLLGTSYPISLPRWLFSFLVLP